MFEDRGEGHYPRPTIDYHGIDDTVIRDYVGRTYQCKATIFLGLGQTEVQQIAFFSRVNRSVLLLHRNSEEAALRGIQNRLITVELVYPPRLPRAVSQTLSSGRNLTA